MITNPVYVLYRHRDGDDARENVIRAANQYEFLVYRAVQERQEDRMSQSKISKDRLCQVCGDTFVMTAREITDHARTCTGSIKSSLKAILKRLDKRVRGK